MNLSSVKDPAAMQLLASHDDILPESSSSDYEEKECFCYRTVRACSLSLSKFGSDYSIGSYLSEQFPDHYQGESSCIDFWSFDQSLSDLENFPEDQEENTRPSDDHGLVYINGIAVNERLQAEMRKEGLDNISELEKIRNTLKAQLDQLKEQKELREIYQQSRADQEQRLEQRRAGFSQKGNMSPPDEDSWKKRIKPVLGSLFRSIIPCIYGNYTR